MAAVLPLPGNTAQLFVRPRQTLLHQLLTTVAAGRSVGRANSANRYTALTCLYGRLTNGLQINDIANQRQLFLIRCAGMLVGAGMAAEA